MPGEFELIDWIRRRQRPRDLVSIPSGDDLAALRWPATDLLLVGVDQVLDGVHFDSAVHTPREIGRKVMNRNLSDCAAMAALPAAAVATVALPRDAGLAYAQELYLGLCDAADPFDFPVVGGDTATWDGKLAVTVTIMGRSAGIDPVTRAGAKPGDGIYVTGPLGGSIIGRHMNLIPRIHLARNLASHGAITAMIDVSDGLSRDLRHICRESGVGAIVRADTIPIHADAVKLSERDGGTPLHHALHDGEDHELLFTSSATPMEEGCTRIGTITADPEILLEDSTGKHPLQPLGWEHRLA